jgi:hypothetical protein
LWIHKSKSEQTVTSKKHLCHYMKVVGFLSYISLTFKASNFVLSLGACIVSLVLFVSMFLHNTKWMKWKSFSEIYFWKQLVLLRRNWKWLKFVWGERWPFCIVAIPGCWVLRCFQLWNTGKPLHMQLIRATSVLYISKQHISELKTNGKNCNSYMISCNICQKT